MTALLLTCYNALNSIFAFLLLDAGKKDEVIRIFDIKLANWEDFWELTARFGFNLLVIIVVVRFLYYVHARRKDYLFTYILISMITFLLCFTLSSVDELEIGFALGLFAIFGIIRYRTDAIPIKEMTYLFVVIGISVINALSNKKISHIELLFVNLCIVGITYVLEYIWLVKHETRKRVIYEKIELVKPENRAALMKDLEERTGLKIRRVEVGRIDFLKDVANVDIYYYADENRVNWADNESFND